MFVNPLQLLFGVPFAIIYHGIALLSGGESEKERVSCDDNIFVEIDDKKRYSDLVFHINALDPNYVGGTVKRLDDVHFQKLRPDFNALCINICDTLDVSYEIETAGFPYRGAPKKILPICEESSPTNIL